MGNTTAYDGRDAGSWGRGRHPDGSMGLCRPFRWTPALHMDLSSGERSSSLSFLKGPLPSAGGQPCAPRALTSTLRLDSRLWAEHPLCGVLGAFHLPLCQDRGWAVPLLPLAALVPGGPRVALSGCRLRREPLTLEETQAHHEGGRRVRGFLGGPPLSAALPLPAPELEQTAARRAGSGHSCSLLSPEPLPASGAASDWQGGGHRP